jgi:hypothetical protein
LFEVEPTVLDRDVPWAYNTLTFDTTRGEDRVVCEIQPGYGALRVCWSRKGADLVRLDLRRVTGLAVERAGGREVLIGTFDGNRLRPMRLQLRPAIQLSWGTTDEPSARQ